MDMMVEQGREDTFSPSNSMSIWNHCYFQFFRYTVRILVVPLRSFKRQDTRDAYVIWTAKIHKINIFYIELVYHRDVTGVEAADGTFSPAVQISCSPPPANIDRCSEWKCATSYICPKKVVCSTKIDLDGHLY